MVLERYIALVGSYYITQPLLLCPKHHWYGNIHSHNAESTLVQRTGEPARSNSNVKNSSTTPQHILHSINNLPHKLRRQTPGRIICSHYPVERNSQRDRSHI